MQDMIRIQPDPKQRVAFARWGVAQTPKVRTVSVSEFAVPPHLYTHMPERLLLGAVVDGHAYIPVAPEAGPKPQQKTPAKPKTKPNAIPQTPTRAAAQAAMVPAKADSVPRAPQPPEPDGSDRSDPSPDQAVTETAPFKCSGCPREFTTTRGRDLHARQAHAEIEA